MNNGRLVIYQGEDKKAILKLRLPSGDPLDLTNVTNIEVILIKKNRSNLILDTEQVLAVQATAISQSITFTALMAGAAGNDILLDFNGTDTLQSVVDDWNTANEDNQVSFSGGAGTTILTATEVQLSGGSDAYYPVSVVDAKLGIVNIILSDSDTTSLRSGEDQSLTLNIDYGTHPSGTRKIARLDKRLDVLKSSAL